MIKPCLRTVLLFVVAACIFGSITIVKNPNPVSGHLVRITASYRTRIPTQGGVQRLPSVHADHQIPKILHHAFLDGLDRLKQAENASEAQPGQPFPGYNSSWRQSCREKHQSWKYIFWDNSRAEKLIRSAYPGFLATFQAYKTNVQKGEVCHLVS